MRADERIAVFVASQDVPPLKRPRPLSKLSVTNFAGPTDRDAAQKRLLRLRKQQKL
jgi:hypothetical protein